jgi:glycosyltransferase involved in cell wall biosynthesis
MAEAMSLGKPVIATGYSGNLDFMDEENSFLVPYSLTSIPPGCTPYPEGYPWADPDLDEAARLMRFVYENPDAARIKAERGRKDIASKHSPAARVDFVTGRFAAIREKRRIEQGTIFQAKSKTGHVLGRGRRFLSRLISSE